MLIKILGDEAIKDKWVEIEHEMGFSGVTIEDYEDWYLHHDKPLVELAHQNCLRRVVEWGDGGCSHNEYHGVRRRTCHKCGQDLKKESELLKPEEIRCVHCDRTYETDGTKSLSACPSCGNWNNHVEAQLAHTKSQEVCPECGGEGEFPDEVTGDPDFASKCLTCQGTGKAKKLIREKVAECLYYQSLSGVARDGHHIYTWDEISEVRRESYRIKADQIITLLEGK